ncbi:MAG: hypothetical protein OXH97_06080 [Chloroflexota bacterium]|nr:hypothetical protein [Chloroflexota bacterium]
MPMITIGEDQIKVDSVEISDDPQHGLYLMEVRGAGLSAYWHDDRLSPIIHDGRRYQLIAFLRGGDAGESAQSILWRVHYTGDA